MKRSPWEHRPKYDWQTKARARRALLRRQQLLGQTTDDAASVEPTDQPVLSLYDWAHAFRRIDGQPFSLKRFAPLEAIYRDDHPNICVTKPAQVGVSELAVTAAIYAMVEGYKLWSRQSGTVKAGLNVGYCFPTRDALSDFSKERFGGLKRESDYLAALFADGEFDDVKFKQIGDSYLYLRGAWSVEALLSFPADILILDEFDRMDPSAIELARKRLRQSLIRRQLCISTPTFPEAGIHALYLLSDQRVWEVRCEHCDQYSELNYFRDVRANGQPFDVWKRWPVSAVASAQWSVACPACKSPIDRCGHGRWRVTNPEATVWHGYQVPALSFQSVKLEELGLLAISHDPTVITEFYRSDLGLPYKPSDAALDDAAIRRLSAEYDDAAVSQFAWTRTTMGVDVGARLHYRIDATGSDGRRYIRAMGSVDRYDELSALMKRYKVVSCVIDAQPELHKTKEWADEFKGRVKRAFYPDGAAALQTKLYALGSSDERKQLSAEQKRSLRTRADVRTEAADSDIVQINRTMAMDAVFAQIQDARILASPTITNDVEVLAQLKAPTRVIVKNERSEHRATWTHTAPDHLYHASVYCLIAEAVIPKRPPGALAQGAAKGWSGR